MSSISDLLWMAFMCIILIIVWPYVRRYLQMLALLNKLPGPKWIELLKHTWKILLQGDVMNATKSVRGLMESYINNYPLIRVAGFLFSYTLLCKVEAVKPILSSKSQLDKSTIYKNLKPLFGDGLLTSKGSRWLHLRRLYTPSLHFKMLENYLHVMNEQSNTLVHILQEECKQTDGRAFDICPFISRCTLDILCETSMGQRISVQLRRDHEYLHAIDSLWYTVLKRIISPWYAIDWIYRLSPMGRAERRAENVIRRFTNEVIKNKRRELIERKNINRPINRLSDDVLEEKRRLAFLDMVLEMSMEESSNGGQSLTDEDIRDDVNSLMFGGHHTSLVNICWALYYIGVNPDVQQKIVDELDQIYGGCDRQSTSDDLNNQKYLKCVIKETLRLCPSIPAIGRCFTEEVNIAGYTIPAGTDVMLSIYWVHRDPAHYTDPHTFNPDRFLPENSRDRDPYAFIPFSAGPRNCLGQRFAMMEEEVIISAILRRFIVSVLEQDQTSNPNGDIISTPLHGIRVKLEPRSVNSVLKD